MSHLFRSILDVLSPRACAICGCRLAVSEDEICGVCNWHLPRTGFARDAYDNELARIFWGRFPIEKAHAFIFFQPHNDPSPLIYDLKYHGSSNIGLWLGHTLAVEARDEHFFDGIDILVPVPITWRRRMNRGYNQSDCICAGIRQVTGLPVATKALKRIRFVQSQTGLKHSERSENVEKAFRLERPDDIAGKHVLLVDDIITTGATINACAQELLKAPGVTVSVLSVGYTKG